MANQSGTLTSSQGSAFIGTTPNDAITFTPSAGTYTVEYPLGTVAISASTSTQSLPVSGGQVRVTCASGSVAWAVSDGNDGTPLSQTELLSVRSLVSGAGNPTDLLTGTLQRVTITGAISTTATQAATASGTYYKARVAWNNNGASASAKVRIAVNADNDTHGLMIGQNVKRRDYEMTMGDGVMLVCGVPITRLTFSADGAITGGTHQLQVTFGN